MLENKFGNEKCLSELDLGRPNRRLVALGCKSTAEHVSWSPRRGKLSCTKIGLGKEKSGGANNRSSDRGNTGLVGKRKIAMENGSAVELKLDGEKQNTDSGNPSGG
jgi:hypothetical protein